MNLSLLVDIKNVTKIYRTGQNEYHALKGIDFKLSRGEMTAIVGTSGSGKSTLMNIIGFLDRSTAGTYRFDNVDVSSLQEEALAEIRNQKIGFVFQSFFLLPRFTAIDNVMLPLFYRGESRAEARDKASDMLEKVGMLPYITRKPNELSGGQQQRVAIARALVGNPDIILADEPTGSLDSKTGNEVMELFLRLNENEGKTIIIVTHDKDISKQCRRIVTLRDGHIV